MKKTLVFVLVLGLLGAMAFAQSAPALQWNGYLNMGALVTNDTNNTMLNAFGSDSWTKGRIQLEGKYAADNWGLAFRIRDDNPRVGDATASGFYFKRVYGWVTALNGMVKVQAGALGDYSWDSHNWNTIGTLDGDVGIQLQVMPVAGLNLGFFVPTQLNNTTPNALVNTNSAIGALNNMVYGMRYEAANMGYLALGYSGGGDRNYGAGMPYLWGGLGYTGMAALTAKVEGMYRMTNSDFQNFIFINQQVGYTVGQINAQLYAEEQFNTKTIDTNTSSTIIHLQPEVDYTMDIWNLGAFFSFLSDSDSGKSGQGLGAWAKATVAKGATFAVGAQYDFGDLASAGSQPGQENTMNTATYVDYGGPFFDSVGKTYTTGALSAQPNNLLKVYVDFVWSF